MTAGLESSISLDFMQEHGIKERIGLPPSSLDL